MSIVSKHLDSLTLCVTCLFHMLIIIIIMTLWLMNTINVSKLFFSRVLRQIFICLKYIFDVMFVLFFIIAVSSLMGKYIITSDHFISLFSILFVC